MITLVPWIKIARVRAVLRAVSLVREIILMCSKGSPWALAHCIWTNGHRRISITWLLDKLLSFDGLDRPPAILGASDPLRSWGGRRAALFDRNWAHPLSRCWSLKLLISRLTLCSCLCPLKSLGTCWSWSADRVGERRGENRSRSEIPVAWLHVSWVEARRNRGDGGDRCPLSSFSRSR